MRSTRATRALLFCACGAITQACGDAPVGDMANTSAAIESADAGPSCADRDASAGADERSSPESFASPEEALEAYARLRAATDCTVPLTRRGKPLTIEYSIR